MLYSASWQVLLVVKYLLGIPCLSFSSSLCKMFLSPRADMIRSSLEYDYASDHHLSWYVLVRIGCSKGAREASCMPALSWITRITENLPKAKLEPRMLMCGLFWQSFKVFAPVGTLPTLLFSY